MAVLTYILLLHILNYALAKTCAVNNPPEYISWEKELLSELSSNYNAFRPPSNNTIVNITYVLKTFNFDDKKEVISMATWMHAKWKDERLKWDPDKHHGINKTDVSHFNLWSPYYGLSNSDDTLDYYLSFYHYELKCNGDVDCRHKLFQEAWCSVKLTDWPYDVQECIFLFEPLDESMFRQTEKYAVNFRFHVQERNSAEWYLYDHKHVKNTSINGQVKLTLLLMREAVGLSAIVIWPAFILTVLSVLSLCLDVRRKLRLPIICFSLLGHYYFLTELSYDIPKETHFPPTLLFYYRGSVILSIIIVFLTFLLDGICKSKSTPHNYVKLINDFVYENNYRNYLVFPRWDFVGATVDSKSSNEDWLKFANIVNSVFMLIIVFAYIGFYATSIPKRTYHDINDDY